MGTMMKEKKGLNARQKRFCLLRVSGNSQIDAYRKAGYKGNYNSATKLESEVQIIAEISRLQAKTEEKLFDLRKECQRLSPQAVDELRGLLASKKAPAVKMRAIQEVFDRGWGKPKETIDTGVQIIWDIPGPRPVEIESNLAAKL